MKHLPFLSVLFAGLFTVGCASFEKDWNQAVSSYENGEVRSPEGPWTGEWATKTTGHSGNLRAIVTESEKHPGEYDFRYHATWAKVFSGVFRVRYPVSRSGSGYAVSGGHAMGPFGQFQHRGTISGNSFEASYSSKKGDLGGFSLKRP